MREAELLTAAKADGRAALRHRAMEAILSCTAGMKRRVSEVVENPEINRMTLPTDKETGRSTTAIVGSQSR